MPVFGAARPASPAPRSWPRLDRPRRGLLGRLLVTAALLAGCAAPRVPAAPGTLVDVAGHPMHLNCQGEAQGATVILDAGSGETSLTWALAQPGIARFTRVCAYDRAGYGWSEASPAPRTAAVMVGELHGLLQGAGIDGPLVLVGHSLGGVIVRHYAQAYPAEVSGLVLVDSAHEQQFRRFPPGVVEATLDGLQQLRAAEKLIALGPPALVARMLPLEPRLPPAVAETDRALTAAGPRQVRAMRGEIEDLMRAEGEPVTTLGALPLVVLSRGLPEPGLDAETTAQNERVWTAMQLELAALSTRGRRVVAAHSAHAVQLDEPQAVVDAVKEVWLAQR